MYSESVSYLRRQGPGQQSGGEVREWSQEGSAVLHRNISLLVKSNEMKSNQISPSCKEPSGSDAFFSSALVVTRKIRLDNVNKILRPLGTTHTC